jgi:hypothetical protein
MTGEQISDLNRMLPKGLWFDEEKRKFRVRLYRNRRPLHGGYHNTIEDAIRSLMQLEDFRNQMPERRAKCAEPTGLNFAAVCTDMFSRNRSRTVILNVRDDA